MSDEKEARLERARQRASWTGALHRLGAELPDDLSATTTPEERIAMMTALSEEAWRVAGRPLPAYTRATMPGRVFRAGEVVPDDDRP